MLQTALNHIESKEAFVRTIEGNANVMICCGRMGPMCVPVYRIMEELEPHYPHVAFRDMEFDCDAAGAIKSLPECAEFMGLPFTVYFKNATVVKATSSIQSKHRVENILKSEFQDNA